jgi:regulator of sirC expression with transglutaminase-like and TPR domain
VLTSSEIRAIVYLLDDSDEDVVHTARQRLSREGQHAIALLEDYWESQSDTEIAGKIENLIQELQQSRLEKEFEDWKNYNENDLLQANLLVNKIQYPGLNAGVITQFIDKIRLDAWMAMYSAHNPLDRVKILNHILFDRQGFTGNNENYHAPDNSFISRLIETRTSNPITMCNLYSILAQRLGMPVFGVNLPQHFVLAWCEEMEETTSQPFNSKPYLLRSNYGKVLFYINPFSRGQVFLKKNIDEFLNAIKVAPRKEFYEPCNNIDILRRMLRNLHFSYGEIQNKTKVQEVENYMCILGMEGEMDLD